MTLWAMVSQFLYQGTQRSCGAAATRVASLWETLDGRIVGSHSGGFCAAKAKIPSSAVRDICCQLADRAEGAMTAYDNLQVPMTQELVEERLVPLVLAHIRSLAINGRLLMIDGFTFDAADTVANQGTYPQNPVQKPGLGFPIIRAVGLFSLTTGLLLDAETAAYSGKGTGETNLFRTLWHHLREGDILLADSYYCTYWLVAMCQRRGVELVMKNHHKREGFPDNAVVLDASNRLVTWTRPDRPDWMANKMHAEVQASLVVRLSDIEVDEEGFRTTGYTVATTLVDHEKYPNPWLGSCYRGRWNVEGDIRSIKVTEAVKHVRAKDPEGVCREFWSGLLAYNLIRLKMLQVSCVRPRDARSLSFAQTHQMLATNWLLWSTRKTVSTMVALSHSISSGRRVGDRLGRIEPRANKRREKILALLTVPRDIWRAAVLAAAA